MTSSSKGSLNSDTTWAQISSNQRTNSQLDTGEERCWPDQLAQVSLGEVGLLVELRSPEGRLLRRRFLHSFRAPTLLPPLGSTRELAFVLKAIDPALVEGVPSSAALEAEAAQPLELGLGLVDGWPGPRNRAMASAAAPSLEAGIRSLLETEAQQQLQRNLRFAPFNRTARDELFEELDRSSRPLATLDHPGANKANTTTPTTGRDGPILAGLAWLAADLGQRLDAQTLPPGASIRQRLELVLAPSGLLQREVLMNASAFDLDCGPLIAFHRDDPDRAIFLRPSRRGYLIWDPDLAAVLPLAEHRDHLESYSPRMLNVIPALGEKDLSVLGLFRFAYGQPNRQQQILLTALVVGLVLGWICAIGNQVGATRWIFALGGLGALVGTCLAVVPPGFRLPIAMVIGSKGLGLLTPTFNTILTNQALPDRDLGLMLQMAGILLAGALVGIGLEWSRNRDLIVVQIRGAVRLEFAALDRLLRLPVAFFQRYSLGELSLRFQAITAIRRRVNTLIQGGLIQALLTSLYLLFMLRISVKLTLLAILVALILLIPSTWIRIQTAKLEGQAQAARGEALGRSLEMIEAVSQLRLAGAEQAALRYWSQSYRRSASYDYASDAKAAVGQLLETLTPQLGILLIFVMLTRLAAEAQANPAGLPAAPNLGDLLGFLSAFGIFIGSMVGLAGLGQQLVELQVDWQRAKPIFATPLEIKAGCLDPGSLQGALDVERINYRYGPGLGLALDRVSLKADPGDFIALVGPSGCGKSTLIRLLLGFSQPEEGVIRYDGKALPGLKIDAVRRQIGSVLQHSGVFTGSLFNCIAGSALISLEQAWDAAELVGLADHIREMPMGMQTLVPAGGGTFSGGQRQLLSIARALVLRPRILIFDEATSALDNRTQAVVTASLNQLKVTRIVVAHRLSTIRHADQIVVLRSGQVEQRGNYDELMEAGGLFETLMRQQIA